VFIGPDSRVGEDCILYPNVVIYDDSRLGNRVILHGGCVIGQDGFGYSTHGGKHEKIPPVGWVEIGDDVEMGACCCVDRATMGPTVVGAGTKFSNGVVIGHGSTVGKGCLFSAQAGIAGSVSVGDYVAFGAQSGVSNHIHVGKAAKVAAKSGVMSDVPAGQEVGGAPAIPLNQAMRALAILPQLPEMRRQLKKLQDEVAELREKLKAKS
jgi:UDP-3-O-[3-hydroxymyristoyl] glucosamine N-acyltransferase